MDHHYFLIIHQSTLSFISIHITVCIFIFTTIVASFMFIHHLLLHLQLHRVLAFPTLLVLKAATFVSVFTVGYLVIIFLPQIYL